MTAYVPDRGHTFALCVYNEEQMKTVIDYYELRAGYWQTSRPALAASLLAAVDGARQIRAVGILCGCTRRPLYSFPMDQATGQPDLSHLEVIHRLDCEGQLDQIQPN